MYVANKQETITLGLGTITFHKVIRTPEKGVPHEFLYEDLETMPCAPDEWVEIDSVTVPENCRRRGIGSSLIHMVKSKYEGLPIILKAGFVSMEEYDAHYDNVKEYLESTKVPFYEYNGFVNINDTPIGQSENIIMAYPKSFANKFKEVM